jgi:hypothetical protein
MSISINAKHNEIDILSLKDGDGLSMTAQIENNTGFVSIHDHYLDDKIVIAFSALEEIYKWAKEIIK